MQALLQAIKQRRSVRKFRPDELTDGQVEALLEAIQWAPSWANTQCWEIVLVKESEQKRRLQETVGRNPAFNAMVEAPLVLVLCARKERAGFKQGKPSTRYGDWFMYDLGLANQNLCLAAFALGLGTVIVGRFDHAAVEKICNVPDDCVAVTMVPIGVPDTDTKVPPRKDLSEFVHEESF
jgi:nitroreductase